MATLSLPRPLEFSELEDYEIPPRQVEIAREKYVIAKEHGVPGVIYRQAGPVVNYKVQVDSPESEKQASIIEALSGMGFGSDFEPFAPPRDNPTVKEEDAIRFIRGYKQRKSRGPTAREIGEIFGTSEAATGRVIRRLNAKGLIARKYIGFGHSCLTVYETRETELV